MSKFQTTLPHIHTQKNLQDTHSHTQRRKITVLAVVEDNTCELRNYSLVTQQRKFFICSFEAVCSWCCKTRGV